MSVLVDAKTRVVVQGITGREGSFHTGEMLRYGTQVVAGATPGRGGSATPDGVPVFDTVSDAVRETGADASIVFVPGPHAADAIVEAADAGVALIVAITDGIPVHDVIRVLPVVAAAGSRVIGPNCPGVISPTGCKLGIMPGDVFQPGPVGVVSRSGTLTYEIVASLTRSGLGQSTCIGIGGDPVIGTTFLEVLRMFEADGATEAIVLVGEIGGSDEETAAAYIPTMSKPVVSFIGGRSAPAGKRMGHAGAIVSGRAGTAAAKVEALREAGSPVADTTGEVATLVKQVLAKR
ncbi:MAG: succinate--CoA ligase subunit alpha [Armatimonadetes bacterium]|nr:succinate--CoA ligase subunit alpha [Armatimonadota bacterium]